MIEERYKMNLHSIAKDEMQLLKDAKVCVVGCGGLGGHIIELLARLGIGHLVVVDGDTFTESNLNRQLLCTEEDLGKSKAEAAFRRVKQINSEIDITHHDLFMDKDNAQELLAGCNVAVDALDNIESRIMLEDACEEANIKLVHGAIGGWHGQVAVVTPGSGILKKLYAGNTIRGDETALGNPAFIPANIASIQVAECVKVLINKESSLIDGMLLVDLLTNNYEVIRL